jgi:MFS family permease
MLTVFENVKNIIVWIRNAVPFEKRNIYFVYTVILIATSLDNLNSISMLTMSENIQSEFNTTSSTASWVLSGYALTLGSFILITGKIADVIGPHNIFLIGLTIVWICALICALIPHTSIITLIVFRALQGIGASSLVPSMIAITANYFSGKRSKYLSYAIMGMLLALVSSLGVGTLLGGIFSLTSIGYKSFFYFVFSVGFLCDLILFFLIIPIEKTDDHQKLKMKNIDYVAAFLVISGTLLIILGLTNGGDNWKSSKAIAPLIVGVFTCIIALLFEGIYLKRYKIKHLTQDTDLDSNSDWRLSVDLLFPPEILKIPNFLPFLLSSGLYYSTLIMIVSFGVQYYILIEHNSPLIASLKVFPVSVGLTFGAIIYKESYYKKIGFKNMFILSAVLTLCGTIWYSRTNYTINNSYWKYGLVSLFMYGYGNNIFFNIYFKVIIDNTPLHLQGVVNGIFQTSSQVLLAVSNALVPSILGNVTVAYTSSEKEKLHYKLLNVLYVVMGFEISILFMMVFFVKYSEKNTDNFSVNDEIIYQENIEIDDFEKFGGK